MKRSNALRGILIDFLPMRTLGIVLFCTNAYAALLLK